MSSFIITTNTVFLSILLQALPFMLLGILISSILHIFISDNFIVKIFPNKHGLGFLTAIFGGLFFPVCECATVPILSGLVKKGVAMPIAITFMLAAPILNPISIMATLYAFPENPMVAVYRILFGIITAASIGCLLLFYPKNEYLKEEIETHTHHCSCGCSHDVQKNSFFENLKNMFLHTGTEFFNVGPYLILGALITALIRAGIPSDFFTGVNEPHSLGGILIMMLFAFIFSACSTSDAFIARSFYGSFSLFSIMGFLVYGPMMDLKNIFMLLSIFKKRFVIELTVIITIMNVIFISAMGFVFL
ncbi:MULTISPECIES: permease [unclassified Treponema]|uniref:permease n=1 Tax=unclassified Treponema TaxID=2638727 RepID=UPI0020A4A236|nr:MULTISPECIES: permease [unclassified Treponema]UTC66553.1 permease [Treponema sp. OMZ 789]UTC69285.1 permease [Treponema sp. OMZ 790]UTC71999.1 permease [Treponema sp. OMZ 791]